MLSVSTMALAAMIGSACVPNANQACNVNSCTYDQANCIQAECAANGGPFPARLPWTLQKACGYNFQRPAEGIARCCRYMTFFQEVFAQSQGIHTAIIDLRQNIERTLRSPACNAGNFIQGLHEILTPFSIFLTHPTDVGFAVQGRKSRTLYKRRRTIENMLLDFGHLTHQIRSGRDVSQPPTGHGMGL